MRRQLGDRVAVVVSVDPQFWALPVTLWWSRHEIAVYLLCGFVAVEWFPRQEDRS